MRLYLIVLLCRDLQRAAFAQQPRSNFCANHSPSRQPRRPRSSQNLPPAPESDLKATLQLLQDMQATNAATIKKQEAALAALDELEQAANELKIFSKRG